MAPPLAANSTTTTTTMTGIKKKLAVLPQIKTATMRNDGDEHEDSRKGGMAMDGHSQGGSISPTSHFINSVPSNTRSSIASPVLTTSTSTSTEHHSPSSAISMQAMQTQMPKHADNIATATRQSQYAHHLTDTHHNDRGDLEEAGDIGDGRVACSSNSHQQPRSTSSELSHNASSSRKRTSLSASRRQYEIGGSDSDYGHSAIPYAGLVDSSAAAHHTRSYSTSSNPRSAVEGSFILTGGGGVAAGVAERNSTSSSRPVSRTQSRPSSRMREHTDAASRATTPLLYAVNSGGHHLHSVNIGNGSHSSSSLLTSSDYLAVGTEDDDDNDNDDEHANSSRRRPSARTVASPPSSSSFSSYLSPSYIAHRLRQHIRNAKAALAIGVPGEWRDLKTGKRKIPQHLKAYVPLLIWVAVSVLSGVIVGIFHDQVFAGLDALSTYLKEQGLLGDFILYLCIFITTFPPLPLYSTLIILSGYSFGLVEGFIVSYAAALSGAVVVFLASKLWLKNGMDTLLNKSPGLKKVVRAVEKRPNLLFLIRVSPYPYNVMNVLLASSNSLSFSCYFWCTALALPKLLIHCSIGTTIRSFAESAKSNSGEDGTAGSGGSEELEREQSGQRMKAIAGLVGGILCFGVFIYIMIIARRAVDDLDDSDRLPSIDSDTRSRSSTIDGGSSSSPSQRHSPSRALMNGGHDGSRRLSMTEYQPLSISEHGRRRSTDGRMMATNASTRGRLSTSSLFNSTSTSSSCSKEVGRGKQKGRSSMSGGAYLPYQDGDSSNTSREGGFEIDIDPPVVVSMTGSSGSTVNMGSSISRNTTTATTTTFTHQRHSYERQDSSMPFALPDRSTSMNKSQNWQALPPYSHGRSKVMAGCEKDGGTQSTMADGDGNTDGVGEALLLGSEVVNRLEQVARERSSSSLDGRYT